MSLKNKRVLITCGPTWVPIDDTRIISNISTGQLGQLITKDLVKAKAKVTMIEGPVNKSTDAKIHKLYKFNYYDDFLNLIKKELKKKCLEEATF